MIGGLKSKVGLKSKERKIALSELEMKDFAVCVKATVGNTVHTPISSFAIPTVFTIFRGGEFELIDSLGIQLKQVLHAEQEYQVEETLLPGEELHYTTTLTNVMEKKGKGTKLAFLVFQTDFIRTKDAARLAVAKSTMVYRELPNV